MENVHTGACSAVQKDSDHKGGSIRIRACGTFSVTVAKIGDKYRGENIRKYGGRSVIDLDPGTVEITIRTSNKESFPCIYVEGLVNSDETWTADDMSQDWAPVGTNSMFTEAEKTPEVFPFSYEKIYYKKREVVKNGVLFDFGRETFAGTRFFGLSDRKVYIQFGESREEALDREWSVIHFDRQPVEGNISFEPYAFRYILSVTEMRKWRRSMNTCLLHTEGAFAAAMRF